MRKLELLIPPPIVAGLAALGMWLLAARTPALAMPDALRIAGVAVFAAGGLGLIVAGAVVILHSGTTIDPRTPSATHTLVCSGVYRLSRNPIYLGDALLLAAWAIHLAVPAALLCLAAFVAWIDRFQIAAEERALGEKFPVEFSSYMRRVRRWI